MKFQIDVHRQHLWRNRLARSAVNRKVAGSSPARCESISLFFFSFSFSFQRLFFFDQQHTINSLSFSFSENKNKMHDVFVLIAKLCLHTSK